MEGIKNNKYVDQKKMTSLVNQIQESKMNCAKPVYSQMKNKMMGAKKAMYSQKAQVDYFDMMNVQEQKMISKAKSKKA